MKFSARRKGESGQALVELAASMVALACVFLGVLAIAALGLENVSNTLNSISLASEKAMDSTSGSDGRSIVKWNLGSDNLLMTADDTPTTGEEADSSKFSGQLSITDAASTFSALNDLPTPSCSFKTSLDSSDMFVSAAGLVSSTSYVNDPLGNRNLSELSKTLENLTGAGNFSITDKTYIPAISSAN